MSLGDIIANRLHGPVLEKAQRGRTQPVGSDGASGSLSTQVTDEPAYAPQSLFYDPFAIIEQLGYKDRPSTMTYDTLRAIVWKIPLIHSIILTRINQIANFCVPQPDRFQIGMTVRLADKDARPTAADRKEIDRMTEWLLTTGYSNNGLGRDNFEHLMRKVVRDSLTFDQWCLEKVPDRRGRPAAFYAVDAATIRRADTAQLHPIEDPDEPQYVQVYENQIVGEWSMNQMLFGIRNPTTDIRNYNYGISEQEMLVTVVTSFLWAFEYNSRFFSQGSTPKGLLNIKGPINKRIFNAFRQHWIQMVSGVENAWRSPILNQENVEWVDMHQSNRDMEFSAFFDFLIKMITSTYQVDPMEINFKYGDTGAGKSLFESGNNQKLVESKDKGLKPLLRHFQRLITTHLIKPINPDMEFAFVGLEAQTHEDLAKLFDMRSKTTHTVDELRRELDMDDLPNGEGAVLLNPTWATLQGQKMQAEQQRQMMEQAGGFGQDDDDTFGPDLFNQSAFDDDDDEPDSTAKAMHRARLALRVAA